MFNVGDKVIAKPDTPYSITTNGWKGVVVQVMGDSSIYVRALRGRGVSDVYAVNPIYFDLLEENKNEEETKMNVKAVITDEERETLLKNMEGLLAEYDYEYTRDALNKIVDTWATNKADLITAFKRHPNYMEGKFMIVFSHAFNRKQDLDAIRSFRTWLLQYDTVMAVRQFMPSEMRDYVVRYGKKLPDNLFTFVNNLASTIDQYSSEELATRLNEVCPDIHAHKGQKMSRIVNKLLSYIGYNNLPDYNKWFAKYADALNPLQIVRHTALSINPLDYLTMSFGNSWASCHTIDKRNKRHMPNSYEGMYSSGTVSYMLDGTSMVFYTVDASYDGNDFWNEPKINRQMFHWGEDKLVQGRLYPQDNDGDACAYTPNREIVQKIMSEIFEFPNLWTVSKGTGAAGRYIYSEGTHYRDYNNYDNCTLSRPKESTNENYLTVGHMPICIECGEEHETEENINCCRYGYTCTHCGCRIRDEEDVRWVDGEPYCDECVSWCDCCDEYVVGDTTEVASGRYVCDSCLSAHYRQCIECGEWHRIRRVTYVDSVEDYVCDDCLAERYSSCDACGEPFRSEDLTEHNGRWLCDDCLEEETKEEDTETQVDEAV